MIRAALSKNEIKIPQDGIKFCGTTKRKLTKLTQLQVMQFFYQEECGKSNTNTTFIFNKKDKESCRVQTYAKKLIDATY